MTIGPLCSVEQALQQLQESYSLNEQLQGHIRNQNKHIRSLETQLRDKDKTIDQLAHTYESNINQMKQLVESRDMEILEMRQQLHVTDYNMIRLKILNEVESAHSQEVEACQQQVFEHQNASRKCKQEQELWEQKYRILKEQANQKSDDYQQDIEEINIRHSKELTKLYVALEQERVKSYKAEQNLLRVKDKNRQLQKQMNKKAQEDESSSFPTVLNPDNNSHRFSQGEADQLLRKLKNKQIQLESARQKLHKISVESKQKIDELQREVKSISTDYVSISQHTQKVQEKQKEIEQLTYNYERKLNRVKEDHQHQLLRLRQENMAVKDNTSYKENHDFGNSMIKDSDLESFRQLIKALEKRNEELAKENETLKLKIQQRPPAKESSGRSNIYKIKLEEANRQIVSLLREKVSLKEEIQKGESHC